MPRFIYIDPQGERREVDVEEGLSAMKAAVNNRIPGIVGECGGELQCATCHVYVDDENEMELPPMSEDEDEMLEAAACERTEQSRLCCQLKASDKLDGIILHTPESQY